MKGIAGRLVCSLDFFFGKAGVSESAKFVYEIPDWTIPYFITIQGGWANLFKVDIFL